MNTRANEFVTAFNYVKEQKALEEKKLRSNIEESVKNHQSELDRIYSLREARYNKVKEHNKLLESCKDEALATCLKAIYIEALEPGTLTDNGIIIAEDLVDSWIKAKGGASRIIAENRNKNYLINRICSIAEETALREVDEVESIDKEDEANSAGEPTTDEEKKNAKVTQLMAQAQALIAKATAIQNGEEVSDDDTAEAPVEEPAAEEEKSEEEPKEEESSEEGEDSGEKIDAADLETEETESEEAPAEAESEEAEEKAEDAEEKADEAEAEADEKETEAEEADEEAEESEEEAEADSDDLDVEDSDDDDDEEEDEDDDTDEDEDPLANPDLGDDDEGESEDIEDDGSEDGSDITGDEGEESDEEEEVTVDSNSDDPKSKMFDELEKEEDVKKAVELIRQRVADAEEDFIKRNAEDKKQIDDLLGKISDNIKTVENISDNDSPKSKVAQEAIQINTRKIKNITETRSMRVFEKIVRNLSESVVKDKTLNESYTTESGQLDVAAVVESAKIIYGFLECLNTIGLEKIDKDYLQNVLNNI